MHKSTVQVRVPGVIRIKCAWRHNSNMYGSFFKIRLFFFGIFFSQVPAEADVHTVLFTAIRSAAAGMYYEGVLSLRALPGAAADGMNQSMSEVKNSDKLISFLTQKQQCSQAH
jgi:hypothetical protein